MFKLQTTFVTLALVAAVLSSPIPAPSQRLTSSGNVKALSLPGLDTVTNLLGLGGEGNGDDSDNGSSGGLLGLKRQDDEDTTSDIFQDLTGLLGSRQDDANNGDNDADYSNENASRDDALALPLLGGGDGGSTGLGGLSDTLGGILGSLGKGLGQLL